MSLTTIWKFPIVISGKVNILVPVVSQFMHAGLDLDGRVCLWLAVDHTSGTYDLEIIVVGTGHPLPRVGSFLGTVKQDPYMWHLFTGPGHGIPTCDFAHNTRNNDLA